MAARSKPSMGVTRRRSTNVEIHVTLDVAKTVLALGVALMFIIDGSGATLIVLARVLHSL
jgi:hypothetical protein